MFFYVLNVLCYILHIKTEKKLTSVFIIFFTSTECPELNKPRNGDISCRKVSGKLLCTLSCDEGYSFNAEAVTVYGCGPDTNWQWNDMEELVLPKCSSM